MSRCLKCNYELTFLERRHKFKCAKCSSIFPEKEIKLAEFKKYNNSERKREKSESKRAVNRKKSKKYYQRNKEKERERARKNYWKHREEILEKRKEEGKREKQNETRKVRRNNNLELTRINGMIDYWKGKQKSIAESRVNSFFEENPFGNAKKILPTFTLA